MEDENNGRGVNRDFYSFRGVGEKVGPGKQDSEDGGWAVKAGGTVARRATATTEGATPTWARWLRWSDDWFFFFISMEGSRFLSSG
jgi:hypothetical protein